MEHSSQLTVFRILTGVLNVSDTLLSKGLICFETSSFIDGVRVNKVFEQSTIKLLECLVPGYTSFFNFLRSFAVRIVEKIGNFPRFSRDNIFYIDDINMITIFVLMASL